MDPELFQKYVDKHKSLINEYKPLLKSPEDTKELDEVLQELSVLTKNNFRVIAALRSMPAPGQSTEDDTRQMYNEAYENQQPTQESNESDTEEDTEELNNTELNQSIIISQSGGIPTDPITQNLIKSPARNKICNHVYENSIILAYLQQAQKAKGKRGKKVKCPHIGCTNNNVKADQIVKDAELKQKIELLMKNTEDPNISTIDI